MDTTAQTISHCIAFANSTKQAVGFACQVSQGDSIRADIKAGKYEGVSFPEPRKGKWKGTKSKIPEATRRAAVMEVHALRQEGMKAKDAVKECGMNWATYRNWQDQLNIDYRNLYASSL